MTNQFIASDPNHSVWVSASAGTGKTKILTDRVLRLLLDGNHPSKILCITFTKAASAEMSNRINNELASWAVLDQENLIQKLTTLTGKTPESNNITIARRLFSLILDSNDGIKIQTIHSFCQSILKRFPIEANIANNYKIIDEATSETFLQEAKMQILEKEDLKEIIEYISWQLYETSFDELIREIIAGKSEISNILASYDFSVESIIEELAKRFNIDQDDSNLEDYIRDNRNELVLLLDILPPAKENELYNLLETNIHDYGSLKNIFLTKENTPRKLVSKANSIKFPQAEELVAKWQELILTHQEKLNSLKIIKHTQCFLMLAKSFIDQYQLLKNNKSLLDYGDLISITNNLLTNNNSRDWVLYKLDGGIDHILVDEAQDTSKEQWQIIESLCAEFFASQGLESNNRTLFVVGDEKQSIFSFQGADPKNFNEMHRYFNQFVENINLETCYRSTAPILKLVDEIFKSPELATAVTANKSEIIHRSFREKQAGSVTLWPLVQVETKENNEHWLLPIERKIKHSPSLKLAQLIATNIEDWISNKKILKSKNRPITEGDIMILVRRRNELTDNLVKELKKRNIKVAGIDRMKIADNIAIMDLMALADFLLLQSDDLSLACVLKSPLFNLSEENLMELAIGRDSTLWHSLKSNPKHLEVYNSLKELIYRAKNNSPFALFSYIIEVIDGRKKLCARLGEEVNDPIDEFINLSLSFEKDNIPSLQNFVKWFRSSTIDIKRDLESSLGQIRIMTIHASKGLQAPIVILADTVSVPNSFDKLIYTDLVIWPGKIANYNKYCLSLRAKKSKEEYNEYLRLLYVALTRAEDQLIICGYKNSQQISNNCWYRIIESTMKTIAKEFIFEVGNDFTPYLTNQAAYVIESDQLTDVINNDTNNKIDNISLSLPEFLFRDPPKEPLPLKQIIASTKISTDNQFNYSSMGHNELKKGNIIHKLLEFSSIIQKDTNTIHKFINQYGADLDQATKYTIYNQYIKLLETKEFEIIFGPNSKAEASVTGVVGDKFIISGKIDRLVILEDEVMIIDYKSDSIVAKSEDEVHPNYLQQMASYQMLMKEIYPDKKISCWLIWTNNASLMSLSQSLIKYLPK
jgi:ATP-dependent helicase/nuclease subunit A